ncbi:tetratricopeptide repeat protein 1 isoform 2-T3 [Aulostomus maculatus]
MSNAQTRRDEGEEEDNDDNAEDVKDNFYDCQETLEPSGVDRETRPAGGCSHRLTDTTRNTDSKIGQQLGDTQGDGLRDEWTLEDRTQNGGRQDEAMGGDTDAVIKADVGVEFDDDYLREEQKELTEDEKESRRQQSLTLKEKGNHQFKAGGWLEAEQSYTEALVLCPVCFQRERAVLFSNRAAARLHLDRKDQAILDCSRAIELNPDYVRALLRRAELYEQTEKLDEALEDYRKVLERDPNQTSARQACVRLPSQIQERNEKLKEEMLSKLKDLGNTILRPFGLSTNNFQVTQDTASGSYSINFVQNNNR